MIDRSGRAGSTFLIMIDRLGSIRRRRIPLKIRSPNTLLLTLILRPDSLIDYISSVLTYLLIIYKQFNFCRFRASAYTNIDRLCAVFLYNICCFHDFIETSAPNEKH